MTEYLIRTGRAPSLVVILEYEAPTRIYANASGEDLKALEVWIGENEARRVVVAAALADRAATGGPDRGLAWVRALAAEDGGIVSAVERLLERLPVV